LWTKAHVGVDADLGLAHGGESDVFANAGYLSVAKYDETQSIEAN